MTTSANAEDHVRRNIVRLRDRQGWSQTELARRMQGAGFEKYTQMTVSRTEKGERAISVRELYGLCEVFDVLVGDLLNDPSAVSTSEIATALEGAHKALEDALARVDELRVDLALAAEGVDWEGRKQPPWRRTVEFLIERTVWDLVEDYVAERNVRVRATEADEVPKELARLRGREPLEHVGRSPRIMSFPFVEAMEEADAAAEARIIGRARQAETGDGEHSEA